MAGLHPLTLDHYKVSYPGAVRVFRKTTPKNIPFRKSSSLVCPILKIDYAGRSWHLLRVNNSVVEPQLDNITKIPVNNLFEVGGNKGKKAVKRSIY